jgi:hypothetical protein
MRCAVLSLLAVFPLLARTGEPKPSSAEMKEKLHAVVRQQLEAFRRDDYAAAYVFAAPSIKAQFPVEAFEKMVRTGYPLIAKSSDASFGLTLDDGERAVVTVRVTGADQRVASYHYLLERTGDDWRIAGVQQLDERTTTI